MREGKEPRMIKCTDCPEELPEDDLNALVKHMETFHLGAVAERLKEIGLHDAAEKLLAKMVVEEELDSTSRS